MQTQCQGVSRPCGASLLHAGARTPKHIKHKISRDDQQTVIHGVWTTTPVPPEVWRRNAFSARSTDDHIGSLPALMRLGTGYLFLVPAHGQHSSETLRTGPGLRGLRTALAPLPSSFVLGAGEVLPALSHSPWVERPERWPFVRTPPCIHYRAVVG